MAVGTPYSLARVWGRVPLCEGECPHYPVEGTAGAVRLQPGSLCYAAGSRPEHPDGPCGDGLLQTK